MFIPDNKKERKLFFLDVLSGLIVIRVPRFGLYIPRVRSELWQGGWGAALIAWMNHRPRWINIA